VARNTTLALALAAAAAIGGMLTTTASATASTTASPTARTQRVPMTALHIAQVVSRSGDKATVKFNDGSVRLLPAKAVNQYLAEHPASTSGSVKPDDISYGNCGWSYIYMEENPSNGGPWRMNTGFHTNYPAEQYAWAALVEPPEGPSAYYEYHASGWLSAVHNWDGGHTAQDSHHGLYVALVDPDNSWALTTEGFCFSGGPSSEEEL
jgi:hypothetical protein